MSNEIALWKGGLKVAVCGGYMAQPDQNGIYRLLVDTIYPTDAAFQNHIDIIQKKKERRKNMTKRFCDLCGKEIHNLQETYRVSVENNARIPYASDPNIVDMKEICPACANRIHQAVQNLKLEG